MSLRVFKPGILDTIQDLGRFGHQHLGINPGGVMDRFAAQAANILVGNTVKEAVIEMHFPASVYIIEQAALLAFCGAEFSATINGEPVPANHPVLVNKNSILQFHKLVSGARGYLAVRGGFDIPLWLGSRSTNLKAGAGGFKGRGLMKDDVIAFRSPGDISAVLGEKEFMVLPWSADLVRDQTDEIAVLPGHEWERLTTESRENFTMTSFLITQQSDRMGYRLNNIPLPSLTHAEVLSSGVSFGTIQLLPDGKLIILMADHQTTGGYPRVAHVISAHLPRLAQLKAGDKLRFQVTDPESAEAWWTKKHQHLLQLQNACTFRLSSFFPA